MHEAVTTNQGKPVYASMPQLWDAVAGRFVRHRRRRWSASCHCDYLMSSPASSSVGTTRHVSSGRRQRAHDRVQCGAWRGGSLVCCPLDATSCELGWTSAGSIQ